MARTKTSREEKRTGVPDEYVGREKKIKAKKKRSKWASKRSY